MKTKILYPVLLLALLASCSQMEVEPSSQALNNDLRPVSLQQGITPLLTPEQLNRFDAGELRALDDFLMNPYASLETREDNVLRIPAGSSDALADAISRVAEGGIIILESGRHSESGTVTVDKSVSIQGERGAVLEVNTAPIEAVGFLQPALHVLGAEGVKISRLTIESPNPIGGAAILLEEAPRAIVVGNILSNHQFGIVIEQSDRCWISLNTINASPAWQTGDIGNAIAILNINGKRNGILGNTVTDAFLGTFTSDEAGLFIGNELSANFIGYLLCKVTPVPFPDRTLRSAETSCTDWLVLGNSSHDNFNTGYLVIDGANKNDLQGNKAANNAAYDIELAGVSERFGFTTPTSFDNRVVARQQLTVKNCGDGNTVIGGIVIDTTDDPCF